jgi:hypothetical protein
MLQNDFSGQYGKGYHPPTHDVTKDFGARAMLGAPLRLAQEFSLEQYIQQIYDQGQTSSCVGWSFAQAVKLRLAVMGSPIGLPSPEAIYVCARAMEREQAGLPPDGNPLQDNGTQSLLAVQAMQKWGIPSNDAWPFDPTTINNEPSLEELEVASAFQLSGSGFARITSVGDQRIADIKQAISAGYPVQIGTSVDKAFEDYNGTGLITAPVVADILGGHAMHLVGFRADGAFRGVNQWGTSWGDSGLYWADPMFVMSDFLDAIVLMVGGTGHSGSMIRKVAA